MLHFSDAGAYHIEQPIYAPTVIIRQHGGRALNRQSARLAAPPPIHYLAVVNATAIKRMNQASPVTLAARQKPLKARARPSHAVRRALNL